MIILAYDQDPDVKKAVYENEHFPEDIKKLAAGEILINEVMLTPEQVEKLCYNKDGNIRENMASRDDLSRMDMIILACDEKESVRKAIYENPNVSEDIRKFAAGKISINEVMFTPEQVEKLCNDEYEYVRRAVALRNDLTPEHVEKLCNDEYGFVRRAVASRDDLSKVEMMILACDENA